MNITAAAIKNNRVTLLLLAVLLIGGFQAFDRLPRAEDPDFLIRTAVITTLFPKVSIDPHETVAVTCGPPIMYRFVLMEMLGKGIPENHIYLSLERRMKCGVGKCGHCQIHEYYCCQDGPVFRYADIKGLEEAL